MGDSTPGQQGIPAEIRPAATSKIQDIHRWGLTPQLLSAAVRPPSARTILSAKGLLTLLP